MATFKIFKHPDGSLEAVKSGWSWPAFFFSFIWAMVKKMWALGVGTLVGALVVGMVMGATIGEEAAGIAGNLFGLIANIVFALNGNQWRETSLQSRGFEFKETLTARNVDEAKANFLKGTGAAGAEPLRRAA